MIPTSISTSTPGSSAASHNVESISTIAADVHAASETSAVEDEEPVTDGTHWMPFDVDSTYGTDEANSSIYYETVGSTAYSFPSENGRTYHAYQEGKYLIPNDEKEQDRMDLVYHSMKLMFNGAPFFAPVKNPQRIADMATGTGIWAIDVGDQYKSAQVIGIDLSPIQPHWVPPNVEFRVDDIDKEWIFEHPLDLVHSRLCSGMAIRDWPKYLRQAYDALKPGGWVEAQEFNNELHDEGNTLPQVSMIRQWHEGLGNAYLAAGCDLKFSGEVLKRQMIEAGFVNVVVLEFHWPMNPWHEDPRLKEAGAFIMMSMLEDMEALSLASMTRYGGWEVEDLKMFLKKVRTEWRLKGIKMYWQLFVVYGQKPGGREEEGEEEGEELGDPGWEGE